MTPDAGLLNPGQVQVTLHGVPVTVTASSVLVDAKAPGRYGPANLLDEDPGTLWAEGAKSTGAGEWVELSFPPDTPVHAFLVTPGNPKSAKLYKANARPRKVRLDLRLHDGRRMGYELDFPRDFPAGGAIYVSYERQFAVKSARLTVLTVWPGSRYRDLCLGGFVPVFRGPWERYLKPFLGEGRELAPTLAKFMEDPGDVVDLLPPKTSGVAAWLRTYPEVPHSGRVPSPVEEFDLLNGPSREWNRYRRDLDRAAAGASHQSELFRLLPEPDGRGYVFAPMGPPKGPDSYSNFRVHWARVEDAWRVVELDVTYREQTADD
ncbi:discoidin domain-containing protein [Myxococcus sp. RHSTA-1-4]|uniref:discoidin domain-containing protein n=1 Tax=Myxococcus sp. RHSTA-1-4 TaxID=2874601 RepID=UPI001CBC113A|nr:discoidin domain-containing protein [Myxococcus sp. RHSTA-1-4]MBZ4419191.1 discoidin domain-containing protein [Myxococcus sp. RHSTA-1-4]